MAQDDFKMPMIKKQISITEMEDNWLQTQLASGHFNNESEVLRELIRESQASEPETEEEIAQIRAALIEGEKSGISKRSVQEIFKAARESLNS